MIKSGTSTSMQNFITIRLPFTMPPPNIRKSRQVTRIVFGFFRQPSWCFFTISTSNDVVLHKDVPFGGFENKIVYFGFLFPHTRNLGQFLTRLRNFRLEKASIMVRFTSKLSLIVIVAHAHFGDVLQSNITFCDICCFTSGSLLLSSLKGLNC